MLINYKLFDNSEIARNKIVQVGNMIFVQILVKYLLKFLFRRYIICFKGSGWKEQNMSMFWIFLENFSKEFNKELSLGKNQLVCNQRCKGMERVYIFGVL